MPQARDQRCDLLQLAAQCTAGGEVADTKRLKALQAENAKLMEMLTALMIVAGVALTHF